MNPSQMQRELRLHRLAMLALAAAFALLMLNGAAPPPPRELTLTRLTLVDGTGERVALLETADTGPHLVLFDRQAKPRLEIALRNDTPSVALMQPNGIVRLGLTAEPRGAGLAVTDDAGQLRGELRVVDGHPELLFRDARGKARLGLGATEKAAGMLLYGEQGRSRATFAIEQDRARLLLTDPSHAGRVLLQAGESGATGLQLLDPQGKVLWEERERRTP